MVGRTGALRSHRDAVPGERIPELLVLPLSPIKGPLCLFKWACGSQTGSSCPGASGENREIRRREKELQHANRRLAELDSDLAMNLDLLKRNVLNEEEFTKANKVRRGERTRLTGAQTELVDWLPTNANSN